VKVAVHTWRGKGNSQICELSSIISLAHKWQFETMSKVAFKAYVLLEDIEPIDKIVMQQKYKYVDSIRIL
jgi:hypothetical protein